VVPSRLTPIAPILSVVIILDSADVVMSPFGSTHIAELILALARHVIAALNSLNHNFTPSTLPVVQVLLDEADLELLTLSLVSLEEAFRAK
jgi:hypothetical protein